MRPAAETFLAFLRLGLTSFGGPVAHVGRFRREFVERRRWMDDAKFADTVALCQFLPGPTSSQVGFAIGLRRAGMAGGLAAWTGFTAPSAVALGIAGCVLAGAAGGWLGGDQVVAGYALAQAVPGPLFTMASYLGAAMQSADGPLAAAQGAAFLTAAIFLPGLLIVLAALPAWDRLRAVAGARAALTGANCAVIGILAAALAGLVLRVLG